MKETKSIPDLSALQKQQTTPPNKKTKKKPHIKDNKIYLNIHM